MKLKLREMNQKTERTGKLVDALGILIQRKKITFSVEHVYGIHIQPKLADRYSVKMGKKLINCYGLTDNFLSIH